jgi:hypothetical protein
LPAVARQGSAKRNAAEAKEFDCIIMSSSFDLGAANGR